MRRRFIGVLASTALLCACGDDYRPYPYGGADYPVTPPEGSPEQNQPVVIAAVRPPPLSGGTLLVSRDGARALASDPERDRIVILNPDLQEAVHVVATVALPERSEPGRAVEDANGRAHVVLRGGGAIATLDLATGALAGTRQVCGMPRGIAYQAHADRLQVVCAGGELVTLPADPALAATGTMLLDRDLRDVVPWGEGLLVSRFRSAELLFVGSDGSLLSRVLPESYRHVQTGLDLDFKPAVAWRLAPLPSGGAILMHQRARSSPVVIDPTTTTGTAYNATADCGSIIIHDAVTTVAPPTTQGGPVVTSQALGAVGLPVDIAVSSNGGRVAVVGASSRVVMETTQETVTTNNGCVNVPLEQRVLPVFGEPIAVAYLPDDRLLVQLREPPVVRLFSALHTEVIAEFPVGGESRVDTGHAMFHGDPDNPSVLACASCHPEGRDDGHVWSFIPIAGGLADLRRTQSLAHGIDSTAPFHWDGNLLSMSALVDEVMVTRMGRSPQSSLRVAALDSWLASVPRAGLEQARSDPAQVARGEAIFHDPDVGCSDCHDGPKLTNNQNEDVGTGGEFQVPSLLRIADRAPYLHNGCAPTLRDRFGPCGGGDHHGHTSQLTELEIDDLIAYLETL
jgi:mono/diheme cytochrome c family protein